MAELYAALVESDPGELLAPLVEASGGRLDHVQREDVVYRPGRDASLRFAADVFREGVTGREGWVVHAAASLPAATYVLDGPAGRVAGWRVRDDPGLPGLRPALERDAVAGLLADLGLAPDGLSLQLLAYRPLRRAVVCATTATHRIYVKCLPADRVAELHARQAACAAAGLAVPRPLGVDPALGLLVLTPLEGTPLRDALMSSDAPVPPPTPVMEVARRFGEVPIDEPARDAVRQARGHVALLRTVLPAAEARLDEMLAQVRTAEADTELCVVHGDFYDQQVLVRGAEVVGVVDVDGAGRGHPSADAANLLAHLHVLTTLLPPGAQVHGWLPEAAAEAARGLDPDQLRLRTAAVLLGLATWPHSTRAPGWEERTTELLDLTSRVLAGAPSRG